MKVIRFSFKIIYTIIFLWLVSITEFNLIQILNTVSSIRVNKSNIDKIKFGLNTKKEDFNFDSNNQNAKFKQIDSNLNNNEISIFSSLGNLLENIGQEITYKKSCQNNCHDSPTNTTINNRPSNVTVGQVQDHNNTACSNSSSPIVKSGTSTRKLKNKDIKQSTNGVITNPSTPSVSSLNPNANQFLKVHKNKLGRPTKLKANPSNRTIPLNSSQNSLYPLVNNTVNPSDELNTTQSMQGGPGESVTGSDAASPLINNLDNSSFNSSQAGRIKNKKSKYPSNIQENSSGYYLNQAGLDFDQAVAPDDTTEASIKMLIDEQIKTSKIIQEAIKKIVKCTPDCSNDIKNSTDSSNRITPNNPNLKTTTSPLGANGIIPEINNRQGNGQFNGYDSAQINGYNNPQINGQTNGLQHAGIPYQSSQPMPFNPKGNSHQNIPNSNNQHNSLGQSTNQYSAGIPNTNINNLHNNNNIQNHLNKNMFINQQQNQNNGILVIHKTYPDSNNEDCKDDNISNNEMICFTKHPGKQYNYWQTEFSNSENKEDFLSSDNFCYMCCENELKEFALHCCLEKCDLITQGIEISEGCSPFFN